MVAKTKASGGREPPEFPLELHIERWSTDRTVRDVWRLGGNSGVDAVSGGSRPPLARGLCNVGEYSAGLQSMTVASVVRDHRVPFSAEGDSRIICPGAANGRRRRQPRRHRSQIR